MYRGDRKGKLVVTALLIVGFISGVSWGALTTGSWYLDESNTFADGVNYGEVDILANSTTGVVSFTVTAMNVYTSITGLFGIDEFGFNTKNITSAPNTWTLNLPSGWGQLTANPMDHFGIYQVDELGGTFTRYNPLVFSITLPDAANAVASNFEVLSTGVAQEGNTFFSAHVGGFQMNGSAATSHYIGGPSPIPEPMTLMFSLLGLGLIQWLKRRLA